MNLKEYIKKINAYLLKENFDDYDLNTLRGKIEELQELKDKFEEFIKKINDLNLTLEDFQEVVKDQNNN